MRSLIVLLEEAANLCIHLCFIPKELQETNNNLKSIIEEMTADMQRLAEDKKVAEDPDQVALNVGFFVCLLTRFFNKFLVFLSLYLCNNFSISHQ